LCELKYGKSRGQHKIGYGRKKRGDLSVSQFVKVNGVLEFVRTVKIQGFDFFRFVNHEGVDTVLVRATHSNFQVEDAYMGFIYITLRDHASVIGSQ
jgi:hypothetical protein